MGNSTGGCNCNAGPTPPERQRLDADTSAGSQLPSMDTWEFNALELNPEQLGVASLVLMQAFFWGCGGADPEVLPCFICAVREGYLPNPYHNFAHGVDVLQTVIRLGKFMPWEELLSPPARFALLVAALSHDIGHPGFSNVYLIDVRDEMASRYNDVSPLENMHCSRLFEIISQIQYNVLGHLSRRDFAFVRKLIIDAILHTDAANHGYVTAALEMVYRSNAEVFDSSKDGKGLTMGQVEVLSTEENRPLVARTLLSGADVTNQAKPWSVAYAWASLLRQELTAQGDRERQIGLAVLPMNDRQVTSFAEAHVAMLHTTVVPFISAEARIFKAWQQLASTLAVNVREWGSRLSKESDAGGKPDSRIELMVDMLTNLRSTSKEAPAAPAPEPAEPPPIEEQNPLAVKKEPRPSIDSQEEARELSQEGGEAGPAATEPCSEPSCPEGPPQPFVREIRRWREAGTANPGQQRELVLLYVVSDDIVSQSPSGTPVLFRYTIQADTSPPTPTNGDRAELQSLAKAVPGGQPALPTMPPAAAAPPSNASGGTTASPPSPSRRPSDSSAGGASSAMGSQPTSGMTSTPSPAQVSMDSVCRNLDRNKFDFLMGAVLEDLPDLLQNARERRKSTSEGSDGGAAKSTKKKQPMKNFMNKVRLPNAKDQKQT